MELLEIAARIEAYDPNQSPDNRADEMALHQEIVMATGIGSLTVDFEHTFVRSLDAAMTLVPEGWQFRIENNTACLGETHPLEMEPIEAATPALALAAAALKAELQRRRNR
jgi:hypothetical protein